MRQHSDWASRHIGTQPCYCLPPRAIESLSRPFRIGVPALFDPAAVDAESAFSGFCGDNRIVGIHNQRVISFALLTEQNADLDAVLDSIGHDSAVRKRLVQARGMNGRLRGVIGWLLTEPAFLTELSAIRSLYEAIPAEVRPLFPLGRILMMGGYGDPSQAAVAFASALVPFLDKWGLAHLASWDLPAPQGPLLPNFLREGSAARPAHGVWVYLPVHYPLQGDDAFNSKSRVSSVVQLLRWASTRVSRVSVITKPTRKCSV